MIQVERAVQPFAGRRNDFTSGGGVQMPDEFAHPSATFGFGQRIGDFHEHPVGGEQAGAEVAGEFQHALVVLVATAGPGEGFSTERASKQLFDELVVP